MIFLVLINKFNERMSDFPMMYWVVSLAIALLLLVSGDLAKRKKQPPSTTQW